MKFANRRSGQNSRFAISSDAGANGHEDLPQKALEALCYFGLYPVGPI